MTLVLSIGLFFVLVGLIGFWDVLEIQLSIWYHNRKKPMGLNIPFCRDCKHTIRGNSQGQCELTKEESSPDIITGKVSVWYESTGWMRWGFEWPWSKPKCGKKGRFFEPRVKPPLPLPSPNIRPVVQPKTKVESLLTSKSGFSEEDAKALASEIEDIYQESLNEKDAQ